MKSLRSLKTIGVFSALFLGLMAVVHAGEKTQDLYAPVYTEPLTAKPLKGPVSRMIEFPFELVRWPVDKGLIFTERHRLDKKTTWIYTRMVEEGVKPLLGGSETTLIPYYGAEFNLLALARQKENFPDLVAKTTVLHGPTAFFQVHSELGAQQIGGSGFHTGGFFKYDRREKEPFYGIGPTTSRGDGTSYRMTTVLLGVGAGYEFTPATDVSGAFAYKDVDILNRAHDGKGDIRTIFSGKDIPGLNGEPLLSYELTLNHDARDSKDLATKGSYQKLSFKFTDGTGSSKARYFTYLLDASKYFRLGSPRRVFVTRFFAEYNQAIDHGNVPFFEMAKLGSSGTFPSRSQTERAFVYNRFYGEGSVLLNLEYRYTVMEYKDFKLKAAFFSDTGEVFKRVSKFRLKDLRESYGCGLYLSYAKNTILALSVAHGNEGTQFYIDNKVAF